MEAYTTYWIITLHGPIAEQICDAFNVLSNGFLKNLVHPYTKSAIHCKNRVIYRMVYKLLKQWKIDFKPNVSPWH